MFLSFLSAAALYFKLEDFESQIIKEQEQQRLQEIKSAALAYLQRYGFSDQTRELVEKIWKIRNCEDSFEHRINLNRDLAAAQSKSQFRPSAMLRELNNLHTHIHFLTHPNANALSEEVKANSGIVELSDKYLETLTEAENVLAEAQSTLISRFNLEPPTSYYTNQNGIQSN